MTRGESVVEQLLIHSWERASDRALEFRDRTWTHLGLREDVGRVAAALTEMGVQSGDRIAVLTPPRPEAWITFLAAGSIGAIWVGLNTRYTRHEIKHVLDDADPAVVISLAQFRGRDYRADLRWANGPDRQAWFFDDDDEPLLAGCRTGALDIDERALPTYEAPALIVYTSGSTGRPKGALLSHGGIANRYQFFDDVGARGIVLCNLPTSHAAGMVDLGAAPYMAGCVLSYMDSFSPGQVLERIASGRANLLLQIPTMLQRLAEHPDFASAGLRHQLLGVAFGGAPLPLDVVKRYEAAGLRMQAIYGSTESTVLVAETPATATAEEVAGTLGRPTVDIEHRIVDPAGQEVRPGEEGELLVRHAGAFLGYWGNPDATTDTFTGDGYLRMGDLVTLRSDGWLELRGRVNEVFKSGGFNIYPREIEQALETHPDVAKAVVVEVPDTEYHRVGYAFVVADAGANLSVDAIEAWCRERLANYKVPKHFELRDELPTLEVGKVDRSALRIQARLRHPAECQSAAQPSDGRRNAQPC